MKRQQKMFDLWFEHIFLSACSYGFLFLLGRKTGFSPSLAPWPLVDSTAVHLPRGLKPPSSRPWSTAAPTGPVRRRPGRRVLRAGGARDAARPTASWPRCRRELRRFIRVRRADEVLCAASPRIRGPRRPAGVPAARGPRHGLGLLGGLGPRGTGRVPRGTARKNGHRDSGPETTRDNRRRRGNKGRLDVGRRDDNSRVPCLARGY